MPKDWISDEERAAMERDRPYMRREAWATGFLIATIVVAAVGYLDWL